MTSPFLEHSFPLKVGAIKAFTLIEKLPIRPGFISPLSDADRVRKSSKSRRLLRKEWCAVASLRGYCTVKLFAVVVTPPALVTEMGPDVAPAGTVASMK